MDTSSQRSSPLKPVASTRSRGRLLRNRAGLLVPIVISLAMYGAVVVALGFLAMLLLTLEKRWGYYFLAALGSWALFVMLRYFASFGCPCPLCRTPFLGNRDCGKHVNARKHWLLGYRASLIADVILFWRFVCPYCGEAFRMRK